MTLVDSMASRETAIQAPELPMHCSVTVVWSAPIAASEGISVRVVHGQLAALGDRPFADTSHGIMNLPIGAPSRVTITVAQPQLSPGAHATVIELHRDGKACSFFLRDVSEAHPLVVPEYGLAVTVADDPRTYAEIVAELRARGLPVGAVDTTQVFPDEASFGDAAMRNRHQRCPIWLTVARDMRMFRVHAYERFGHYGSAQERFGYFGSVQPAFHSIAATLPESDGQPYSLDFAVGPGSSCRVDITRRLEDGVLPILHARQTEGDVIYDLTSFVTLETQPLTAAAVCGSAWPAAYGQTNGCMYTPEERTALEVQTAQETIGREEELVCCLRVVARNTGRVPRYAWFKGLRMSSTRLHAFDSSTGFASVGADRIYAVQRFHGKPLPQEEMAVLLAPGATAEFELLIPHQPVSSLRARRLAQLDFEAHHAACRQFWQEKLESAAQIRVPEQAIDERIRAGLLHLDINTLGAEPHGPAMACVGWYAPIGSESAPMIQYYDSVGWHRLAERCLDFFFARQRADGFIQNFGGYQLETGPVLWTAGEHFRYTRDRAWAHRVAPAVVRSCDYLLQWRKRNQREDLRGQGYGLIEGKVADPEDFFHSFMLNAVSYLGLARAAELLAPVDPPAAARLAVEAAAWKRDIRTAYLECLARSPLVPLSDGSWAPAAPSWPEHRGPLALYADGGDWHTHGAFGARDSLIGPLWLGIGEVLDPTEPAADFLVRTHRELMTRDNAGLSQPYYCRHDWLDLQRGDVPAFLQTYYHQLTALQDPEIYTFWEHYFHASPHKTHEEAWFLMQTRWMLWLEKGDGLSLFAGIPRAWLTPDRRIDIQNARSYFGPLRITATAAKNGRGVLATVECLEPDRHPATVRFRLPDPDRRNPVEVKGGVYDPQTEMVTVRDFTGSARVELRF